LNFIASTGWTLTGVWTEELLMGRLPREVKVRRLATGMALAFAAGLVLGLWIPMIKQLCTPFFVLYSLGWVLLMLIGFYVVIEVIGYRWWTFPLVVFGANSIFIYSFNMVLREWRMRPLLAHVDAWQWTPNLIWFDNLRFYGTPNYFVQKMYGTNLGTQVVPVAVNGSAKNAQDGLYTSASIDGPNAEVILKAVNATQTARKVRVDLKGAGSIQGNVRLIVLASADLKAENSLDQPTRLAPVDKSLIASSSGFDLRLDPQSFTVIRAKYSNRSA
jgi:hypothetical protein